MILYEVLFPRSNPGFNKIECYPNQFIIKQFLSLYVFIETCKGAVQMDVFFYFLEFDWLTFDYWDVSGISELEK